MSAFIPAPRPRKPGLPSPRLDIPSKDGPSSSSPNSHDLPTHDSQYGLSQQPLRPPSSSGSGGRSKPKLSLPGFGASTHSSSSSSSSSVASLSPRSSTTTGHTTVAEGFEHLSLDEQERTMRPGLLQPSTSSSSSQSHGSGKPKLALPSRTASPSPSAALAGFSLDAQAMVRSTSLEGALAETSKEEAEYKLGEDVLEDLGRLGEGASGEVRKVRHIPSGLIMAKKTIPASPNEDVHKQILRELAFNRECRADFITRYYGAFLEDSDSQIAICMEYCEGGSLDAIYRRIKSRQGRTGEKVLGKVAEAVLHGLVYLHDRKIIHRDIKPSNILVSRSGLIKLCDFGISGELINSMAGTFCGTSYYMAPERIRGNQYTITADIWSLGLTIHEVASNRFPFPPEGEPPFGPIELLNYIVTMETPQLRDDVAQGVQWTKAIQDFLKKCLEKDPQKRPGPGQMLLHPWIKKSEAWNPDLKAWVAQVWDW